MLRVTICTFILAILFLNLSCWDYQNHPLEPPKHPHFQLTGQACDTNTHEPLSNIQISVQAVSLTYESKILNASAVTDNEGYFCFPALTPGNYVLSANRLGHQVTEKLVTIENDDEVVQIALPKPLMTVNEIYSILPQRHHFLGFCWKFSDTFAAVDLYRVGTFEELRIWEGNLHHSFNVKGPVDSSYANPPFYALTYLDQYWTCYYHKIYSIGTATGKVETTTTLPYTVTDLTTDGNHLWAATRENKIIKFGKFPAIILGIYDTPCQHLAGIAWDGKNLWVSDFQEHLIHQLDHNFQILRTFRLFYRNEWYKSFLIKSIKYLAFDSHGNLWIGDQYYLFKFNVQQTDPFSVSEDMVE